MTKDKCEKVFYGTTTIGEKGQVVIPMEARQAMKLEKGDKLLVFGVDQEMLTFSKISQLEQFASHLSNKLESVREILKKNKK
jgi:AbrB family looped-hinge helix DNA binding protein